MKRYNKRAVASILAITCGMSLTSAAAQAEEAEEAEEADIITIQLALKFYGVGDV